MIWFTADTHFGHSNIIKYCNRPFDSIEEMDEELIRRWNAVVDQRDTVYHLGDFSITHDMKRNKIVDRLNGKIFFVPGSHDNDPHGPNWSVLKPIQTIVVPIVDPITRRNISVTLCHYSMRSWPLSHYASWCLFAHHHGKLEPYGLSFDIGVDTNNFYPYSLDEIETKMRSLKPIIDYRVK